MGPIDCRETSATGCQLRHATSQKSKGLISSDAVYYADSLLASVNLPLLEGRP